MLRRVRRAVLIVNPYASKVTDARAAAVADALGSVEIVATERPGHATDLARELAGSLEALYVFSGDGGYNEVLNGIDRDTPVGFIPGGGASVLPRALGLPRDPVDAARRIASARPRRIGVGRANDRRFSFSAGIGLDAELVRRVDALGRTLERGRAGNLAFAWTAVRFLTERRARFEPALEIRGHGRAAFALVANTDPYSYAGRVPLRVAPRARFELGLDVVAPRVVRAAALPRYLGYVLLGRGHDRATDLLYLHDRDRVEIVCDAPMPLQVDGEDLGDVREVVLEAERDAVTVLA